MTRFIWPIGQVVKTAASHAVNIGSNPVWVTSSSLVIQFSILRKCNIPAVSRFVTSARKRYAGLLRGKGDGLLEEFVLIAMRVHLFPFRTQKLSSFAPTILGGRLPGKIGNANTSLHRNVEVFLMYRNRFHLFPVAVPGKNFV